MRKFAPSEMAERKETLYRGLAEGRLSIRDATREMRKILGMTQADYARKVVGVSPRIISEFERGLGNPTLETLTNIAKPFGLQVGFIPPENWRIASPAAEKEKGASQIG